MESALLQDFGAFRFQFPHLRDVRRVILSNEGAQKMVFPAPENVQIEKYSLGPDGHYPGYSIYLHEFVHRDWTYEP